MADAGDEVMANPNVVVQPAPLDPLATLAMLAPEGSLTRLWKDQWTGNPNMLEEAIQEAKIQWAPFTTANYNATEAFNNAFLVVPEAKPQLLLMQIQNAVAYSHGVVLPRSRGELTGGSSTRRKMDGEHHQGIMGAQLHPLDSQE
jgi:hypothetical protein